MALDQQRQIEALKRDLTEARSLIADLQQQLRQQHRRPSATVDTMVLEAVAAKKTDMLPLFQAMVERSSEAITVANPEAKIIYANRATYNLYRYDPLNQELIGQSVGQFFENASTEAALTAVTPLINGEAEVVHLEQVHQRKDGSTFDVDLKLYALRDDTNNIRAFVGIARDITAQKQAARELEETKDFLESVINNTPGAIYSLDATYQYRYLSPNCAETYGLAWEEMQQNPSLWLDIILPEDRPMVDAVFQGVMAGQQQTWAMEYRVTNRLLGEVRWLSNTGSATLNEQGQLARIDGLVIDITARKQAEEELRETKGFAESIINNMPVIIFSINQQFQLSYLSSEAEKIFGFSTEELCQDANLWMDTLDAEQRPIVERAIQAVVMGQQKTWSLEYPVTNQRTGKITWLSSTGSATLDEQGNLMRIDGLSIDITDRKQAEMEQIRLQEELLAAQQVAIRELSTPIIPVMEGIIILPLVGAIDSQRARDITRGLLAGISENKAKVIIMDITGVDVVDSGVAGHLNKAIQAARLKGSQTIITGISDAVAETVVDLGIDWSQIDTVSNLQAGLRRAMTLINGVGRRGDLSSNA